MPDTSACQLPGERRLRRPHLQLVRGRPARAPGRGRRGHAAAQPRPDRRGPQARPGRPGAPRSALRARPAARPGPGRRPGGPGPVPRGPPGPPPWPGTRPPPPVPRRSAGPGQSVPARPRPPARPAALAATASASCAPACSTAARASPASASARARRPQSEDPGRPGSCGPAAPRPCRAASWRCRNAVRAVCGSPDTGSGSPQYPSSVPASPGRGSLSQPGYAHLGRPRSGLDHRQAPFSADQHSLTGQPPGRRNQRIQATGHHPAGANPGCQTAWHGPLQGEPGLPVAAVACHGQDAAAITPHPAGRVTTTPRSSQPTTGQHGIVAAAYRQSSASSWPTGRGGCDGRADTDGAALLRRSARLGPAAAGTDSFTPVPAA